MDEKILNENCNEVAAELMAPEDTKKKGRFSERIGKVLGGMKKVGTKNLVVLSSLALIGGAVILNFVLFGNSQPVVGEGELLGEGGENGADASYVDDTYFASAELNRKQARDQAIAVLQTVVESTTADALSKEQATADIGRIVSEIQMEANIETLIESKGFEECVAVIGEGSASVIVRSDGLLPNELSQIKEIVWEQAGIDPVSIKIIEQNEV